MARRSTNAFALLIAKIQAGAAILLLLLVFPQPAAGQFAPAPGKPTVSVEEDELGIDVDIIWTYDLVAFPDTVFGVQGTVNGAPFGPIPFPPYWLATRDNQVRARVPYPGAGTYIIQIIALNALGLSPPSEPSEPFTVPPLLPTPPPGPTPPPDPPPPPGPSGPPSTPTLNRPTVQGNAVTLTWSYTGPPVSRFEIIAFIQATGQTVIVPITDPNQRSFTHGSVPSGNYIVRMRAVNDQDVSGLSAQFIVPVGVTLGAGDLSVTLTWNSTADMDLHVVEPNGSHVYYASRQGTTARLDRDDTDGFGPENIFVAPGTALVGNYRIYIVHFSGSVPTTSTIQVTVNTGTPNERTEVFTRQSSTPASGVAIEVAVADPVAGTIQPRTGIEAAFEDWEMHQAVKIPEP